MRDQEQRVTGVEALIQEARAKDALLFCHYQHITLTPDELTSAREGGRLMFSSENWRLISRTEEIAEMRKNRQAAWDEATRRIESLERAAP